MAGRSAPAAAPAHERCQPPWHHTTGGSTGHQSCCPRFPVQPLPSVDELVADDFKESERKTLRTVFDFELWKRHRSSSRYSRHMWGLLESRTVG